MITHGDGKGGLLSLPAELHFFEQGKGAEKRKREPCSFLSCGVFFSWAKKKKKKKGKMANKARQRHKSQGGQRWEFSSPSTTVYGWGNCTANLFNLQRGTVHWFMYHKRRCTQQTSRSATCHTMPSVFFFLIKLLLVCRDSGRAFWCNKHTHTQKALLPRTVRLV